MLPRVGMRHERSEHAEAMQEVAVDEARREAHARHAHGFKHAARAQLQQHARPVDLAGGLIRVGVDASDVVRRGRVDDEDKLVELHLELRRERVHEQR
jgi:hypothetical protein